MFSLFLCLFGKVHYKKLCFFNHTPVKRLILLTQLSPFPSRHTVLGILTFLPSTCQENTDIVTKQSPPLHVCSGSHQVMPPETPRAKRILSHSHIFNLTPPPTVDSYPSSLFTQVFPILMKAFIWQSRPFVTLQENDHISFKNPQRLKKKKKGFKNQTSPG